MHRSDKKFLPSGVAYGQLWPFMETAKHLWLPQQPEQSDVESALEMFTENLRARLLSVTGLTRRERLVFDRLSPQHVEVYIQECRESDLAVCIGADISMRVRHRVGEAWMRRTKKIAYHEPVEQQIVANVLNEMDVLQERNCRHVLATALMHAFLEDTEARTAFFRSAAISGIRDIDNPREDPLQREVLMLEDLPKLFDRICTGML